MLFRHSCRHLCISRSLISGLGCRSSLLGAGGNLNYFLFTSFNSSGAIEVISSNIGSANTPVSNIVLYCH